MEESLQHLSLEEEEVSPSMEEKGIVSTLNSLEERIVSRLENCLEASLVWKRGSSLIYKVGAAPTWKGGFSRDYISKHWRSQYVMNLLSV